MTLAEKQYPREALRAAEADDPRLARLREIVKRESYQEGSFTLTSGRTSSYFFQLRQSTMHPEGASLIGELTVELMRRHGIRCVGGLELGAVPVVSAAALSGFRMGYDLKAFFVRKKAKEHGAKELIDGHIEPGAEVLVVDDVTTTGGSVLRAVEAVAPLGCTIAKALSIVDREEGAADTLARQGIALYALFRRGDFAGV